MKSNQPLDDIGFAAGSRSDVWLEDNDYRNHWHIPGTTREGKSKFLEATIVPLIGKNAIILLDPSDNGATCYAVLKQCIAKGYENVCLIEPNDFHSFIPSLNPLRFRGQLATEPVVDMVIDSLRVLWGHDPFQTPRIEFYLQHLLAALYHNKRPISDAIYFTTKSNRRIEQVRNQILETLPDLYESRIQLEQVFKTSGQQQFIQDFSTTVRRVSPFFKYYSRRLYSGESIPFPELIAKKWVILVNLDNQRVWSSLQSRLLGCIVVNEIVRAIHALRSETKGNGEPKNVWHGRCFLYIDEAGEFATRSLKRIMELKGKSELWVRLAHQYDKQFRDREIAEAIHELCKLRVVFHSPGDDFLGYLKRMYYGEMKDSLDGLTLRQRECIIQKDKLDPVKMQVRETITPDIPDNIVRSFKFDKLYKYRWFRPLETQTSSAQQATTSKARNTSVGQDRRPSAGDIQEPPRHDENPVVQGVAVDNRQEDGTAGDIPVGAVAQGKVVREANHLPKVVPKR